MGGLPLRIQQSFFRINWRLYLALLLTAGLPTIYTTARIYFLGDLPAAWGVNIASQLAWVNLGLEVVQEAIILPLFFLLGKTLTDRDTTINKLKTGILITFGLYASFTSLIAFFAEPLVTLMAQNPDQVSMTVEYIRLEMVAATLTNTVRFLAIFFVLQNWRRPIYTILVLQLIVSITLDTLLLSQFEFSLNIGVNGIAYSNMVASTITLIYALWVVATRYEVKKADLVSRLDLTWLKEWWHVGKWSGLDSFIRNAFFLIFILRMINVVEEQGTFWVVNGFIWGWLLLPFMPLAELIKQDTAQGERLNHWDKMLGYFLTCGVIAIVWIMLSPAFSVFFEYVYNTDPMAHLPLVLISLPFYVLFMFNTAMDSVLYGRGKTSYLALQSLITNVSVYGTAFVLCFYGLITPSLLGIAVLFGIGIAVDTLVTAWLYFKHIRLSGFRI